MKKLINRPILPKMLKISLKKWISDISKLKKIHDKEKDISKKKKIYEKKVKPLINKYANPTIKEKLYEWGKRNGNCCPSCSYCELIIDTWFMNIEHFEPKSKNWLKSLSWNNLLPCCSCCNTKKLDSDELMVNPSEGSYEFNNHFDYNNLHLMGLTDPWKNSVRIINLNDERIVDRRKKYINWLQWKISLLKQYGIPVNNDTINDLIWNKGNNYEHWCDTFVDRISNNLKIEDFNP